MSLRSRLGNAIAALRGAALPIDLQGVNGNIFGPGMGLQPSDETLLREMAGATDRSARAIGNRVATLNLQVKTPKPDGMGGMKLEILPDHPLKQVIRRPHPDLSMGQILRLTTQWVVTVGAGYWLKVNDKGFDLLKEFHPISPKFIHPIFERGITKGYRVESLGTTTLFRADQVIRFYFPDPNNMLGSEGYLAPGAIQSDTVKFAGQHLRGHYQHDATPPIILEGGAEAPPVMDADEQARWVTQWQQANNNRAGKDRGVPVQLPRGLIAKQLIAQYGSEIVPLLTYLTEQQMMDFGVPRTIFGNSVAGDRSTAETNRYVFDLYTVSPVAKNISEAITLQAAPDFEPRVGALVVEFEEFVSVDKEFELAKEKQDLELKVRVINEVRDGRGWKPVDYGDEPVATFSDVPYRPDERFELEKDDPEALGLEPDRGSDPEPSPAREDHDEPPSLEARAQWERERHLERQFVPVYEKAIKRLFKAQRIEAIRRLFALERSEPDVEHTVMADGDLVRPIFRIEKRGQRVLSEQIFQVEEWFDSWHAKLDPIQQEAFRASAEATMADLVTDDFVFTEAQDRALFRHSSKLIKDAGSTTQKLISRQLRLGADAGEGVDQIAKRIRGVFDTRSISHSRTIARTEMGRASSEAQLAGFDQSGIVESKRWHTSLDAAVRDSHQIERQTVGKDESFLLADGEFADAPRVGQGGSDLSASNAINCRCFALPIREKQ